MISKVETHVDTEVVELAVNETAGDSIIGDFDEQPWNDVNVSVELDIKEMKNGRDAEVNFLIKEHIYEKLAYNGCRAKRGDSFSLVSDGLTPIRVRWKAKISDAA